MARSNQNYQPRTEGLSAEGLQEYSNSGGRERKRVRASDGDGDGGQCVQLVKAAATKLTLNSHTKTGTSWPGRKPRHYLRSYNGRLHKFSLDPSRLSSGGSVGWSVGWWVGNCSYCECSHIHCCRILVHGKMIFTLKL